MDVEEYQNFIENEAKVIKLEKDIANLKNVLKSIISCLQLQLGENTAVKLFNDFL